MYVWSLSADAETLSLVSDRRSTTGWTERKRKFGKQGIPSTWLMTPRNRWKRGRGVLLAASELILKEKGEILLSYSCEQHKQNSHM